jgi:peptidoglycan/LPS O-acetylase OafA/YrhL
MIRIGLALLILASGVHWLLHPTSTSGKDLADGATGLLYGLSIGCMLLGIWKARRRPVA